MRCLGPPVLDRATSVQWSLNYTMVRSRSKSVVQSIASDVATYSKNNVWLATESKEARKVHNPVLPDQTPNVFRHRTRSRSLSDAYVSKQEVKSLEKALSEVSIPLFPFSAAEEEALLHNYLASINYNSVLDSNHINDINNFSDNSVLAFCSECKANASYVQSLLDEGRGVMNKLSALTLHYETVMKKTDDFAFHSTQLLNQQRVLEHKTAAMGQIIQVFEPLDSISATLVSSGNGILKTGKIKSILVQLQENLDFLDAHPSYKDAEKYSMRYRQCMTRGLTLVMNYLVKIFRAKFVDVSARLKSKPPPSILNLDIMMYSEFTNDLERLTDKTKVPFLIGLMVERCLTHSEYLGLLSDVFLEYFKVRHALILAHLQVQPIKDDTLSTVQYCQRLTSAYKRLVEKEYALFVKHFPFKTYSDLVQKHINDCLFSFLRQVLDPLYDDMRNKILRETRIAELCQLANLLDSYYEFDELTSMVSGIQESSIEYGELFEPIINDAQARLIFRIQNFIDNKLLTYKTKPEDLQLANRKKSNDLEPKHALQSEYGENFFPELYYPVGVAFSILSQLYELVSPMVFDDMAHYIVHSCITMLKNGALKLAISHLGSVEARFFYLKNLLMLNSQFDHFEIQYVRTETSLDFTSGILELLNILRQGTLYVNLNTKGGFLELVKRSAPRVINDIMDAKKEIEMELSNTINEIVTECANIICKPILGNDTRDAKAKCVELSDNILMKVPQLHKLMRVFVAEPEIVSFLLQELARLMLRTYETFFKKLAYEFAGLANVEILNEIMEPSALFHFFNETVANLQEQEGETVNFH